MVNSFTNAEYMIAFPFGLVALALLFATANLTNKQPFLKDLAFAEKIWVRNDAAAWGAFREETYGLPALGPNTPRLRTLQPWPGTLRPGTKIETNFGTNFENDYIYFIKKLVSEIGFGFLVVCEAKILVFWCHVRRRGSKNWCHPKKNWCHPLKKLVPGPRVPPVQNSSARSKGPWHSGARSKFPTQ